MTAHRAGARHGRAKTHGRATQHGLAVPLLWPAGRAGSWVTVRAPYFPAVSSPVLRVLSAVLLCFASLDPQGYLEPPICLEIAREIFFSIKI